MAGKSGSDRVYRPGMTGMGTFSYPKIVNPDTKGKFADNKFKTDFIFGDKKAGEAFFKELVSVSKELTGISFDEKNASGIPVKKTKQGKVVRDDDGNLVFKFKSANRPVIVDAKRKRLPKGVDVRGGSQGRISYTLSNYEEGITLYLDAVQITKHVSGSPGANAFEETEGFDSSELEDYTEDYGEESEGKAGDDEGADEAEDKFAL